MDPPTIREVHRPFEADQLLGTMLVQKVFEIYDLNPVLKLDRVDNLLRTKRTGDPDSLNDYRGTVSWWCDKKDLTHTAEIELDMFVPYRHAVVVAVEHQRPFICVVYKAEGVLSFLLLAGQHVFFLDGDLSHPKDLGIVLLNA